MVKVMQLSGKAKAVFAYLALAAQYHGEKTLGEIK